MKSILRLLKNRWFLAVIGLLALAALIWFLGPFLEFADYAPLETSLSRGVTIAALFALWGLNQFRIQWAAKRTNREMLSEMAGSDEGPSAATVQAQEEISELGKGFGEALDVLKNAKLGTRHGNQYLYQLPWYIVIGPPGSGKTTALINSGLRFPLGEERKVRGVGGTRNCDWWFTDEAVLLDTAGRYTTQESDEEVDKAAWDGFLDLLKKHRRRRPINGALVVVSVSDLLQLSELERDAHVQAIRLRLRELNERLGIRFPVYFLFTKCDLLAGFMEFFADLDGHGRAQVWGMTFPQATLESAEGVLELFAGEFTALEQQLNARVTGRLQDERDQQRRDLIYGFPQQFVSLKTVAQRFIGEIFEPTRYEQAPLLRGVYFTSGTQEGSPMDRVVGTLGSIFGLDRRALPSYSGTGRSYFITRLLQGVVFGEAGLANLNLRHERYRIGLQWAAYTSAALVTGVAALLWIMSYYQNQAHIRQVEAATDAVQGETIKLSEGARDISSLAPVLAVMTNARNIPNGYADSEKPVPMSSRFGLYQGAKLGYEARAAYSRLLNKLLQPILTLRLEGQFREHSGDPEFLYEALRVYLMLAHPGRFDRDFVQAWFQLDWRQSSPRTISNQQQILLREHLQALLDDLHYPPALPPDEGRVSRVRYLLRSIPTANRVYARLKVAALKSVPDFGVRKAAGNQAATVFALGDGDSGEDGISGFFTYDGYHKVFRKEIDDISTEVSSESWVLGLDDAPLIKAEDIPKLKENVATLYFADYIEHWQEMLNQIEIVKFQSFGHGAEVLDLMTAQNSPFLALLLAVAHETTLETTVPVPEDVSGALDKIGEYGDRLAGLFGSENPLKEELALPASTNLVDRHFDKLNAVVKAPEGESAPIDRVMLLLADLHDYVSLIAHGNPLPPEVPEIVRRVHIEADRRPAPINRWLRTIASNSDRLTRGGQITEIREKSRDEIVPFCNQAIIGRYPLNRGSDRDITPQDFGKFFGPGGDLDSFYQSSIAPAKKIVSKRTLRQFQRAEEIRNMFFADGGKLPSVAFTLTPISMDVSVTKFVLDIDGQTVSYDHGRVRPTGVRWPNPAGSGQVKITMLPSYQGGDSVLSLSGPWAWFRLLDKSSVEYVSEYEYRVTFNLGGRKATFALVASSVQNPFQYDDIMNFQCPEGL